MCCSCVPRGDTAGHVDLDLAVAGEAVFEGFGWSNYDPPILLQ